MNDLRFAFRSLAKSPRFTAVVILILALGIGANVANFSIVHALMVRALPYDRAEELVSVYESLPQSGFESFAVAGPKYLEWRRRNDVFQEMGALYANSQSLTGAGEPVSVTTSQVTPSYLRVWRLRTVLGRLFVNTDDEEERRDIAILSYALWQRQFGGRDDIVGRTLHLDGRPYTVVGVLSRGGLAALDGGEMIFVPMAAEKIADGPGVHYYQVAARLKPGVTLAQSQAAMTTLADSLRKENRAFGDWGVVVRGMRADLLGSWPDARSLLLMQGAVALVLLIASANTATLLLARAVARKKEIAIRLALGGSRWRVIRQLLVESVVLALLGGFAAVVVATVGLEVGDAWLKSQQITIWAEIGVDRSVLGFALALSVVTGVGFGVVPAWQVTRPDVQLALRATTQHSTAGTAHRRWLEALTVAEIALALILLVGAGLLTRTLGQLQQTSPGFAAENLLAVQTALAEKQYPTDAQRTQFVGAAIQRLQALPGVSDAAAIDMMPMSGGGSSWDVYFVGRPRREPTSYTTAQTRRISPEYFRTAGISLRRGRAFTAQDVAGSPAVVVINETVARRFFPGVDPLGQQIELGDGMANPKTIVGIVPDELLFGLASQPTSVVYVPWAQGWFKGASTSFPVTILVRCASSPRLLALPVRRELRSVNPDLAFDSVRPMAWFVRASIRAEFMRSGTLAAFSATAVLLAALGIYGVLGHAVTQRTNEFGIRLALGAEPAQILRLVFGRGFVLVAFGTLIGLAAALGGMRLLRSFLYDVSPTDPLTLVTATLFLAGVAGLAAWLPARRATRVDPIEALRSE